MRLHEPGGLSYHRGSAFACLKAIRKLKCTGTAAGGTVADGTVADGTVGFRFGSYFIRNLSREVLTVNCCPGLQRFLLVVAIGTSAVIGVTGVGAAWSGASWVGAVGGQPTAETPASVPASDPVAEEETGEAEEGKSMLRHVVMFKFKDEASKEDVEKVVDAFRALPSKIPEIADFEFGTNNSPEDLADGFTHCFLVTFKSEADREVYLPHAAHLAFVEVLKPHLDKVMVIDYWAKK